MLLTRLHQGFNPLSLFAAGEPGALFYLDDALTNPVPVLYQDSAATIPVTAVGQPVGLYRDRSGNNNHRVQATAGSRPILSQNGTTGKLCLLPDGSDDFMSGPMNLSTTDKLTAIAAQEKTNDAATALLAELTASAAANTGAFYLASPANAGVGNYAFASRGINAATSVVLGAAPDISVITGQGDIAGDICLSRRNGVAGTPSGADQGAGNYSNATQYYFARGGTTLFCSSAEYALIIRGAATDPATLAAAERWAASKAGITF